MRHAAHPKPHYEIMARCMSCSWTAEGTQRPKIFPPSLQELGYEAWQYAAKEPGLAIYLIKQLQSPGFLAIIGIHPDGDHASGTLFVQFVDMTTDSRGEYQRPRLRQLLAAFWVDTVRRELQQLGRIVFQNVTEEFTRSIVRGRIAPLMNAGYSHMLDRPYDDIILTAPTSSASSQALGAWILACTHSKLIRSALGILREFSTATLGEELAAVQVVISPAFDGAGKAHNFDLNIVFEHSPHKEMESQMWQKPLECAKCEMMSQGWLAMNLMDLIS